MMAWIRALINDRKRRLTSAQLVDACYKDSGIELFSVPNHVNAADFVRLLDNEK
jgi:hypothetical protein